MSKYKANTTELASPQSKANLFQYVDGCHHTKYTIAASARELQTTLNTMLNMPSFEALHSSVMADFNSPAPARSQPAASNQQL